MTARVVAVDLGASSGRVYAADIDERHLDLQEVGRFANGAIAVHGTLYWDVLGLYQGILAGVRAADRGQPISSIGVDSWAVDYGLVRADGSLLANPVHYRDDRTEATSRRIVGAVGAAELFRRSGIALQRFNTLYQLAADVDAGHIDGAARMLLIPDLIGYFLTGAAVTEATNASTTQLVDLSGRWDPDLAALAGIPFSLLAPMVQPGERIGELAGSVADDLGMAPRSSGAVPVVAVGSHDTASAVVAVPATEADFAYISCGTWSLVGIETMTPIVTDAARQAGFTNERGIDGTVRFLRNVMGLWLLQESVRTWERNGEAVDLDALNAAAAEVAPLRCIFDVDESGFLAPGDMPARIAAACRRSGQPVAATPAELTRAILESLAVAYRRAVRSAEALSGRSVGVVHLVGGGVNNHLLCQLTADACGVPVVAGPIEAAAIGNALVQARSLGVVEGERADLRRFVAAHSAVRRYEPDDRLAGGFDEAAARLGEGRGGG